MDQTFITTGTVIEGYKIIKSLGTVRGIVVRSRSVLGNFGAGIQRFFGGNITLWTSLCERTREEAYGLMVSHAEERGANAVIGFRYDATEIAQGVTEVLAYGTACIVEK